MSQKSVEDCYHAQVFGWDLPKKLRKLKKRHVLHLITYNRGSKKLDKESAIESQIYLGFKFRNHRGLPGTKEAAALGSNPVHPKKSLYSLVD